jgi:5-methylcytosine-specific restriction endonuclease McrA
MKINREEVYNKCGGHCAYCGNDITIKQMQIDHKEPLFRNHTDKQLEHYKGKEVPMRWITSYLLVEDVINGRVHSLLRTLERL